MFIPFKDNAVLLLASHGKQTFETAVEASQEFAQVISPDLTGQDIGAFCV